MTAPRRGSLGLLTECSRRHESLHRQVIAARECSCRSRTGRRSGRRRSDYLPDISGEILAPLPEAPDSDSALGVTDRWLSDITGPRPPKLPRLYRLVDDLWAVRDQDDDRDRAPT